MEFDMAKRKSDTTQPDRGTGTSDAPGPTPGDALEQRVVAFAEDLGRIAGTFQARAEGWLDREALTKQLAGVRDGAARLLEQLGGGAKKPSTRAPARRNTKGRSGGVVDAPGKKHRKPLPSDPGAPQAASQAAKMRTAKTMVKTNRRRGRG